MTITTVAQARAGLRPEVPFIRTSSLSAQGLNVLGELMNAGAVLPAALAYSSAGMSGEAMTSGPITFENPASGNAHLASLAMTNTGSLTGLGHSTVMLWDLLWRNSGISATVTTAQTIDSVTFPARDVNGSTDGEGVLLVLGLAGGINVTGAGGQPTVTYTNSAGTSGRSAVPMANVTTTSASILHLLSLQAGDKGVRSVQSIQLGSAWTTGGFYLMALRFIAQVPVATYWGHPRRTTPLTLGMPKCHADTVPYVTVQNGGSSARAVGGAIQFTHG